MSKRTKYLSYIEETRKHHGILQEVAKESVEDAISVAQQNSVAVTYMEGEEIITEEANGKKTVVGSIQNNRRKVSKGDKATLS